MLENNTQTISSLSDLVNNTLLEEGKTACSVGLSAKKNEDWTAGLVVRVVEPVSQIEGRIAVWLVPSFVVEEVDWYRDVVFRI